MTALFGLVRYELKESIEAEYQVKFFILNACKLSLSSLPDDKECQVIKKIYNFG